MDVSAVRTEGENQSQVQAESSSEDDLDTVSVKAAPGDKLGVSSDDSGEEESIESQASTNVFGDSRTDCDVDEISSHSSDSQAESQTQSHDSDELPPIGIKSRVTFSKVKRTKMYDSRNSLNNISSLENSVDSDSEMVVDGTANRKTSGNSQPGPSRYKEEDLRISKRPNSEEAPTQLKRRKMVSTIKNLSPEPEPVVNAPIPSVISQPSSSTRCVVPSQILIKAMRDANKSIVTVGNKGLQAVQSVKQETVKPNVEKINYGFEGDKENESDDPEEAPKSSSSIQSPSSTSKDSYSEWLEDDRDYYYDFNRDYDYEDSSSNVVTSTAPCYEREVTLKKDDAGPSARHSPTFVVTFNKTPDEYLPSYQGMKQRERGNSVVHMKSDTFSEEEDQRIVKMNRNRQQIAYRTNPGSDEEDYRQFKKFKDNHVTTRNEYRLKRKKPSSDSATTSEEDILHKYEKKSRELK